MNSSQVEKQSASEGESVKKKEEHQLKRRWSPPVQRTAGPPPQRLSASQQLACFVPAEAEDHAPLAVGSSVLEFPDVGRQRRCWLVFVAEVSLMFGNSVFHS